MPPVRPAGYRHAVNEYFEHKEFHSLDMKDCVTQTVPKPPCMRRLSGVQSHNSGWGYEEGGFES